MGRKKSLTILLIVLVILLFVAALFVCGFAYEEMKTRNFLKSLQSQTDTPYYIMYNTLYYGESTVDLEMHVKGEIKEVFVVSDNKCYFVYAHYDNEDNTLENWCIANIDINSFNVDICYDGVFRSSRNGNRNGYNTNNISLPIESRTGFFRNGVIYLTDFQKVIQYDIYNDSTLETEYSKFVYPDMTTAKILDFETIELYDSIDKVNKYIKLSDMSIDNSEINKLYELRSIKTRSGESLLYDFFDTVQVIDNKVYILGRVLSKNGETYVVMLEHDYNIGESKYIDWLYKGDKISHEIYFVSKNKT